MISEIKMIKKIKLKKIYFFIFNICKKISTLIRFLFYILYISMNYFINTYNVIYLKINICKC